MNNQNRSMRLLSQSSPSVDVFLGSGSSNSQTAPSSKSDLNKGVMAEWLSESFRLKYEKPNSKSYIGDDCTRQAAVVSEAVLLPKIFSKHPNRRLDSFAALQEWEGYVRAINNDSVSVDLVDITRGHTKPGEQADIPFQELAEDDLKKLKVGSVFRWVIGFQRSASGTKKRCSQIVFRNLPRWSRVDFTEAKKEAEEMAAFFRDELSAEDEASSAQ